MARDDEAARYRQAAQLALEQIGGCINYLSGIHKTGVSRQLAKNRSAIGRRLHELDIESGGEAARASRSQQQPE